MAKLLRVWWVPQVPMDAFYKEVSSVEEGALLIETLALYDLFQYENKIKPDYCNVGGLQEWDEEDREWIDWYDNELCIEDPLDYVGIKKAFLEEPLESPLLEKTCLSYRHDFGLLSKEDQKKYKISAQGWYDAWRKTFGY